MWYGGGHLHKECPEKANTASTPPCCNCKLTEGEKPHPSNYRGYSHGKEEIRRRRSQIQKKTNIWKGLLFEPHHAWAILRCSGEEDRRENAAALVTPAFCSGAKHKGTVVVL
jgi:hypothetical protein